jgi:membrane protease YdiL (CAAX protease family)
LERHIDLATLSFVESIEHSSGSFPERPAIVSTPSPNDPPWNTPAAVGVWLASVVFILVLPNLFLLPYLSAQNTHFANSKELLDFVLSDRTAILINVLAIIPAHILTLLLAWLVVTRFRRFDFRKTLGWTWGGVAWWHYIVILAVFFAIAGIVSSFFPEQENDLTRILKSSRTAVYIVAFMATFTAPVVEEVIYRGILYSAFQRTFNGPVAVLIVTLLFAMVHVPQYYPSYSTILLLTLLSLVLTLVRAGSGNLLPCIVLHFLFNGIQSAALILDPWLSKTPPDPVGFVTRLIK